MGQRYEISLKMIKSNQRVVRIDQKHSRIKLEIISNLITLTVNSEEKKRITEPQKLEVANVSLHYQLFDPLTTVVEKLPTLLRQQCLKEKIITLSLSSAMVPMPTSLMKSKSKLRNL